MSPAKLVCEEGRLQLQINGVPQDIPPDLRTKLEETLEAYTGRSSMPLPTRLDLPFFAYGLFKPSQLGFSRVRKYTSPHIIDAYVEGSLFERDGAPLFTHDYYAKVRVRGTLLQFNHENAQEAYASIARLEPEKQYRWATTVTTDGVEANVLIAKSLKGAAHLEGTEWDGQKDPHFKEALQMVKTIVDNVPERFEPGSVERLFELQMAYTLLWTSIERYTSLRYHLGTDKATAKVTRMAKERGFVDALGKYVSREADIYSADGGTKKKLSNTNPKSSLEYYYQVRCNVVHRGKALMVDALLLMECIQELSSIFEETLHVAFDECRLESTLI